jgi:uncharacterized protein
MFILSIIKLSSRAAHRAALICCVLLAAIGHAPTASIAAMKTDQLVVVTAAGERTITIELAQTPEEMALGLMYRTSMAEGQGMLFPSPTEREVSMWMRNTYIPLDMIFIRSDGTIHRIEPMTQPLSEAIISSNGPVLAVLEVAGGGAARLGIKPGDQVRHPIFAPRR